MSLYSVLLISKIYHSEMGTDESWAYLYFDTALCELMVIESRDNTTMWPRYAPSGPQPDRRMALGEFLKEEPSYREKISRLVTDKLCERRSGSHAQK